MNEINLNETGGRVERIITIDIVELIDKFEEDIRKSIKDEIIDNPHFMYMMANVIPARAFRKLNSLYELDFISIEEVASIYAAVRTAVDEAISTTDAYKKREESLNSINQAIVNECNAHNETSE